MEESGPFNPLAPKLWSEPEFWMTLGLDGIAKVCHRTGDGMIYISLDKMKVHGSLCYINLLAFNMGWLLNRNWKWTQELRSPQLMLCCQLTHSIIHKDLIMYNPWGPNHVMASVLHLSCKKTWMHIPAVCNFITKFTFPIGTQNVCPLMIYSN